MTTLYFEDQGQEVLEMDIDARTGAVAQCRPTGGALWSDCRVLNSGSLRVGDQPSIMTPFSYIMPYKFPIVRIER